MLHYHVSYMKNLPEEGYNKFRQKWRFWKNETKNVVHLLFRVQFWSDSVSSIPRWKNWSGNSAAISFRIPFIVVRVTFCSINQILTQIACKNTANTSVTVWILVHFLLIASKDKQGALEARNN